MEFHILAEAKDISRYVFCPGSQARAKRIASYFDDMQLIDDNRGIVVYSGLYKDVFMTVCGTGMGGAVVGIALEELAHLGADTFIRVGSCGVFQEGQKPGDIIIATGTFRAGGTANAYLPLAFPAVPTFNILRSLVEAAERMDVEHTVGVGIAGDAFYAPRDPDARDFLVDAGVVSVEMESDALFIIGQYRGWRTGALYTSDGAPGEIKPTWGEEAYKEGEGKCIEVALEAMLEIAKKDAA
ncbi:MAG: nucleoside phosphorylase [Chloroflexi bacterium]|nr:nucleoside phosphorylase [Chloroflexota bacterium]